MDYSVLLGIEYADNEHTPKQIRNRMNDREEFSIKCNKGPSSKFKIEPNGRWKSARRRHKFYSSCNRYIYHVSIIDYLTDFNFNKQVESNFK